jgi:4-hydroxybenzoate polyprenyltransferase
MAQRKNTQRFDLGIKKITIAKLGAYSRLVRLDKPIGTLLLLWPTLWAIWISSNGAVDLHVVVVFVLGTFLMRSAGCAANDIADREFDPLVSRTKDRPLASGEISTREALAVALMLSLASFALVLTLNALTVALSFLALFLAISYPYTKRFLSIPQAYLGIAFGFGIPMAWAATRNEITGMTALVLIANVFWAIAYDTEYAMVDRDDDVNIGIRTSAILFGSWDVAWVFMFHAAFLFMMSGIGILLGYGVVYYLALLGAAILIAFQYPMIKARDREGCFRAFLHNNWVGGVIFLGIFIELF